MHQRLWFYLFGCSSQISNFIVANSHFFNIRLVIHSFILRTLPRDRSSSGIAPLHRHIQWLVELTRSVFTFEHLPKRSFVTDGGRITDLHLTERWQRENVCIGESEWTQN
jgi:hypothetical protein